jgi:hypothetical protein
LLIEGDEYNVDDEARMAVRTPPVNTIASRRDEYAGELGVVVNAE